MSAAAPVREAVASLPVWMLVAIAAAALGLLVVRGPVRLLVTRVGVPLVVAVVFYGLYHLIADLPAWSALDERLAQETRNVPLMIEVFGGTLSTIYALLVAFVVFKSMQDHDNINEVLRDEASHLDGISKTLTLFEDRGQVRNMERVASINALLTKYADNILSSRFREGGQMAENARIADDVWAGIARLEIEDDNDRIAFDRLVEWIYTLTSLRARRISYMVSRPSPFMRIMLIVLSLLIVAPFYLPSIGGPLVSPWFVGSLAFVLSFLFIMTVDMGSHFSGFWRINRKPFDECRDSIRKRTARPRA